MKRGTSQISWMAAVCVALLLTLAACGGGEGSGGGGGGTGDTAGGDGGTAPSTTVADTAAAGSPISGLITARDAAGHLVVQAINADGSFSFDVSSLTPPFLIRAEGLAGGRAYTLFAAGTAGNVGGTVNVTPLTDLIVANVVGSNTQAFFLAPDFSQLTAADLAAAEATLRTRLASILTALNVPAGANLLTTPFAADQSGLDALLNALDVTVGTSTNQATITFKGDGTTITDDLTTPADTAPIVVAAQAVADWATVQQGVLAFADQFRAVVNTDGVSAAQWETVMHPSLLNGGMNRTQVAAGFSDPDVVAYLRANPASARWDLVGYVVDTGNNRIVAKVVTNNEGQLHQLWKDGSAGFLWAGTQQQWSVFTIPYFYYQQAQGIRSSGIECRVDDSARQEFGSGVTSDTDTFTCAGPNALTITAVNDGVGGFSGEQNLNASQIAALPDLSDFVISRWDSLAGAHETYTNKLLKAPHAAAGFDYSTLPQITFPLIPSLSQLNGAGQLPVQWTLPAEYRVRSVAVRWETVLNQNTTSTETNVDFEGFATEAYVPTPDLAQGETLTGILEVNVFTRDVFGRYYNTIID